MGILGFRSRALRKAEQGYHSSKLEFLSLNWAVCEQFRDYLLYAKEVHVSTDSNPLLYVLLSAKLNATGKRLQSTDTLQTRQDKCGCRCFE